MTNPSEESVKTANELVDKGIAEMERRCGKDEQHCSCTGFALDFVREEIAQALDEAKAEGYKDGHIDHQLVLETSSKAVADHVMGRLNGLEYTFHARKIKEQIRAEERERCVKRVEEEISKHHRYMTKDELFACIKAKLPIKDLK